MAWTNPITTISTVLSITNSVITDIGNNLVYLKERADKVDSHVGQQVNTTSDVTFKTVATTGGLQPRTFIASGLATSAAIYQLLLPYVPNVGDQSLAMLDTFTPDRSINGFCYRILHLELGGRRVISVFGYNGAFLFYIDDNSSQYTCQGAIL